jgi:hypothetical protein
MYSEPALFLTTSAAGPERFDPGACGQTERARFVKSCVTPSEWRTCGSANGPVLDALCDSGERAGLWMSAHLEPFEAANVHDPRARSALTPAIGRGLAAGDAREALRRAEEAWLRRAGGPNHPDAIRAELLLAWAR